MSRIPAGTTAKGHQRFAWRRKIAPTLRSVFSRRPKGPHVLYRIFELAATLILIHIYGYLNAEFLRAVDTVGLFIGAAIAIEALLHKVLQRLMGRVRRWFAGKFPPESGHLRVARAASVSVLVTAALLFWMRHKGPVPHDMLRGVDFYGVFAGAVLTIAAAFYKWRHDRNFVEMQAEAPQEGANVKLKERKCHVYGACELIYIVAAGACAAFLLFSDKVTMESVHEGVKFASTKIDTSLLRLNHMSPVLDSTKRGVDTANTTLQANTAKLDVTSHMLDSLYRLTSRNFAELKESVRRVNKYSPLLERMLVRLDSLRSHPLPCQGLDSVLRTQAGLLDSSGIALRALRRLVREYDRTPGP